METQLEDGDGEDGQGALQRGLHVPRPQSPQLRQALPCRHIEGVNQQQIDKLTLSPHNLLY